MKNYTFADADKELFAVYYAVYASFDFSMNWDFNALKWDAALDGALFLERDGDRIGGAVIAGDRICRPFLIPPFCDRPLFWSLVLKAARERSPGRTLRLTAMTREDAALLSAFGCRVWRPRKCMARPAADISSPLPEGFSASVPAEDDLPELAEMFRQSFAGGIVYELFGEESVQEIEEDMRGVFALLQLTDTLEQSVILRDKTTGGIVGACVCGVDPEMPHGFAFLYDVCVLPRYRRRGLAEYMARRAVTKARETAAVIKLHLVTGNPAESLYRKLGFTPGPDYIDMKLGD